jgi:hypothetical protein
VRRRITDGSMRATAALVLSAAGLGALGVVAGGGLAGSSTSAVQYQYGKVTICHRTHSKKHPFVTITVAKAAIPAHLAHGDKLGPCPTQTTSTMSTTSSSSKKQKPDKPSKPGKPTKPSKGKDEAPATPGKPAQPDKPDKGNGQGGGHGKGG